MPANTSTLDPLLKDDYGRGLKSQLNDEVPLLKLFSRVDQPQWQGRQAIEAIHVNRNRGAYATAESGQPPTAGNQQIENFRIPIRHLHGAIQITTQLVKASRNNKGAFARGMRLEMDRLLDDLRTMRNFYLWGDGRGIRALIDTASAATTITLDAPGGFTGDDNGARFLNVGDSLAIVVAATGALEAAVSHKVTAVSSDGANVTVTVAPGTGADNTYIVKAYDTVTSGLSIEDTEFNHAPMGLSGMVDDGTFINSYFGLSRTTFPILQSTVISSVGALSADVIQRAIDVTAQIGRGKTNYHIMHPSVRRAYLSLMENDRRYTQSHLRNPDAGTKAAADAYGNNLTFGGVPLEIDHFAPYGYWFGMDTGDCKRYVLADGEWADETGAILTEVSGSVDTYKAVYRIYENFANLQPNKSFRLDGISANVVVVHVN